MPHDIVASRRALLKGKLTAAELVERSLAAIASAGDEAGRIFVSIDADAARKAAADADRLYAQGEGANLPLLGIPISVKDLFDVAGQVSTSGTVALRSRPSATKDAVSIGRLRAAGAVIVGRTSMSELAFSGVGVNPHYGTPSNPRATDAARITGGSSSGAAASVARGMALAGIGSDTGGSVRIPAALCGLVGYKPTQSLIPLDGTVPLSHTLDSIGPIGLSVADCALLTDVMAGKIPAPYEPADLAEVRLLAPTNYVFDGASADVVRAFRSSLEVLRRTGVSIDEAEVQELSMIPLMMKEATFPAYEGYRHHRELVRSAKEELDPLVLARLEAGGKMTDEAYSRLLEARKSLIEALSARMHSYHGLIMPTVPITAPEIASLNTLENFNSTNLLLLRNPTVVNLLNGCAISLPQMTPGALPTGLSIAGLSGHDDHILRISAAIEGAL